MSVTIQLRRDQLEPWLLHFRERIAPGRLAKASGGALLQLVTRHLRNDVGRRHATAERLGASPTGHWETPGEYTHLKEGADGAEVTISKPGIARAVRDVTIRPVRAKALTIPMHALAYGKRPAEAE